MRKAGSKVSGGQLAALLLVAAGVAGAACGSDAEQVDAQLAGGDTPADEAEVSEADLPAALGSLEQAASARICSRNQRACRNGVPQICNASGTAFVNQPACIGNRLQICEGPTATGAVVFAQLVCEDGDACTVDSCNAATRSCAFRSSGAPSCPCTASAQCTGGGVCAGGRCVVIR